MGLRIVREQCACCQTAKCCEYGIHAPLPFTPDAGWSIVSIDVSNNGANQCAGRARAEIVLSKPANPQPDCPASNLGCGIRCRDGFRSNYEYFEVNNTAMFAKLTGWVNAIGPLPSKWTRTARNVGGFQSWYTVGEPAPGCSTWRWRTLQADGTAIACTGECAGGSTSKPFFEYETTDPAERYHSTQASRDAAAAAAEVAFKAFFDAWWASSDNPSIKWTMGTCDYELTPNRAGVSMNSLLYRRCVTYNAGNPPGQRWIFCGLKMYDFRQTVSLAYQATFSIRCAGSACSMADYNWPLTLPCSCTAEYDHAGVTASPSCGLHLISTRREWAGELCLFIAEYGGAIEAGEIECLPGSTNPDCVCCDEGQA